MSRAEKSKALERGKLPCSAPCSTPCSAHGKNICWKNTSLHIKLMQLGVANRIVVVELKLKSEFNCRFQSKTKSNDANISMESGDNSGSKYLIKSPFESDLK